jgi:hypothetical protein
MLVNGARGNAFSNDTFNIPVGAPMPSIGSGWNGVLRERLRGLCAPAIQPGRSGRRARQHLQQRLLLPAHQLPTPASVCEELFRKLAGHLRAGAGVSPRASAMI